MRRLLRIVTWVFVAMTVLLPVLECFDRWDRPGLANDTELPVFLVVLFVTLVLVAVTLLARRFYAGMGAAKVEAVRYRMPWSVGAPVRGVRRVSVADLPLRI